MKNQKMFLTVGGIVIELIGIVLIIVSLGTDLSAMIGIFIMIIGTGVLVTGILAKPQKDE